MATPTGERVKALRKEKGLTLEQLATAAGTSKSRIWELENRDNQRPTAQRLASIADALETTVEFLMGIEEQMDTEEVADVAFYRQYRKMPAETRRKIREMVKIWGDEP
ncbi:helix-turn-helix domain-containing protein [Magnetofaba australis]|nr:helix-turn-helix transcriptional regulator [Magnetofaba australis]